ncbi:MAG: response regulator [Chloroflexi bacterium]|nr:response regulator [Chloroflexota bacterium]
MAPEGGDPDLTPARELLIQAASNAETAPATADILLVDDEENVRLTISGVLALDGHHIATAPDMATARELMQDRRFEVLIVDLHIGQDNGLELLREARAREGELVGIVITGYASLESAIEALHGGAFSYLLKPFDVADLRQAIAAGLARRRLAEANRLAAEAARAESERQLAQRVARRAIRLQELTAQLSSSLATKDVLERIVHAAVELLECQTAGVFLCASETEDFHLAAGQGLDPERAGTLTRSGSMAGRAAQQRRTLSVPDVRRQREPIQLPGLLGGRKVGAVAVAPIMTHGQVLGVIEVYEPRPHAWEADELDLLTALASAAAVALDNSRLYEAMQRAIFLRDHVLGTVSHDLKNPIAALSGRVQLLQHRLRRNRETALAQLDGELEHIHGLSLTMAGFLDELVDTIRLQAGENIELRRSAVDLSALAAEAIGMVQPGAQRHRIHLEEDAGVEGNWDRNRLERVILNLVGNAVKYSPEGGEVRVRISREDGYARLTVTDQGIGIRPEDVGRIFDPFQRGGNVSGIPGSGLGLAGARRIVEMHGGTLEVDSSPGQGATFSVRLPRNEPAA